MNIKSSTQVKSSKAVGPLAPPDPRGMKLERHLEAKAEFFGSVPDFLQVFSQSFSPTGDAQRTLRGAKPSPKQKQWYQDHAASFYHVACEKLGEIEQMDYTIGHQDTDAAVLSFYSFAHSRYADSKSDNFPLAGKNKCVGFAMSNQDPDVIYCAVSQDSSSAKDRELRQEMRQLIADYNSSQPEGSPRIEFVPIPSNTMHIMMRALVPVTDTGPVKNPLGAPAKDEIAQRRSRCVEPALMTALCRAKSLTSPNDLQITIVGGNPWEEKYAKGKATVPVAGFVDRKAKETPKRQAAYLGDSDESYLTLPLGEGKRGYLDRWGPCSLHCQRFYKQMLAIGVAGAWHEPEPEPEL